MIGRILFPFFLGLFVFVTPIAASVVTLSSSEKWRDVSTEEMRSALASNDVALIDVSYSEELGLLARLSEARLEKVPDRQAAISTVDGYIEAITKGGHVEPSRSTCYLVGLPGYLVSSKKGEVNTLTYLVFSQTHMVALTMQREGSLNASDPGIEAYIARMGLASGVFPSELKDTLRSSASYKLGYIMGQFAAPIFMIIVVVVGIAAVGVAKIKKRRERREAERDTTTESPPPLL